MSHICFFQAGAAEVAVLVQEPLAPMSTDTAGLAPGREDSPMQEELKLCLGKPALPLTKLAVLRKCQTLLHWGQM